MLTLPIWMEQNRDLASFTEGLIRSIRIYDWSLLTHHLICTHLLLSLVDANISKTSSKLACLFLAAQAFCNGKVQCWVFFLACCCLNVERNRHFLPRSDPALAQGGATVARSRCLQWLWQLKQRFLMWISAVYQSHLYGNPALRRFGWKRELEIGKEQRWYVNDVWIHRSERGFEWMNEWNEMKWHEMKWHEMKWHEMKWNGMEWNEMKWNGMKWDEMKWNELNEMKLNYRNERNEMKWHEMEWNGMNWIEMEWNGMNWMKWVNWMNWNDMKLNEMKLNEIQWNEMRWNEMNWIEWNEITWNEWMKWN